MATLPIATAERNRDRALNLVMGQNFQVKEWVHIINPTVGQPKAGEVIGILRDKLLKVRGVAKINGVTTDFTRIL